MISRRGRVEKILTGLRMHSQLVGGLFGLVWSAVAAYLWNRRIIGDISGTFFVGVGAAIIAAAIYAYLSPFNEPAFRKFLLLRIEDFWPSRDEIDNDYWVDSVHGAEVSCTLLGIAHGKWCEDKRFHSTLSDRLDHGVTFRMLFLNPESTAATLRATEEKAGKDKRDTREAIRKSIKKMWEFREGLEAGPKNRLRLYVYDATPSCGLTWIDKTMVATHYLPGQGDVTSPALLIMPPEGGMRGSLYSIYAAIIDDMAKNNLSVEIDERNIHRFLPRNPPERPPASASPSSEVATGTNKEERDEQ